MKADKNDNKIRIKAFCCKQSVVEAHKMAVVMKLDIPENLDIVEVKCTGLIDILDLMNAFEEGADGVMVIACHEGNCLYLSGNIRAKKRISVTKRLLDEMGVGGERLEMFNLASNMGPGFIRFAKEMKDKILKIGQSPLK
ncbi:hydrogenase iron-sulfur subunit [bacterium]|nr:hydrogenase iron-sulfur subunit [bacterium]